MARTPEQKNTLAMALADQANLPELILVAGYLGGKVMHGVEEWRLLYLDSRLESWLLGSRRRSSSTSAWTMTMQPQGSATRSGSTPRRRS